MSHFLANISCNSLLPTCTMSARKNKLSHKCCSSVHDCHLNVYIPSRFLVRRLIFATKDRYCSLKYLFTHHVLFNRDAIIIPIYLLVITYSLFSLFYLRCFYQQNNTRYYVLIYIFNSL
jgi:hypothetical protein